MKDRKETSRIMSAICIGVALVVTGSSLSAGGGFAAPVDQGAGSSAVTIAGENVAVDMKLFQELQATRGQSEFSDCVETMLEKFPEGIIDVTWESGHGSVLVSPDTKDKVNTFVSDCKVNVVVTASQEGAVPYLKRSSVELPILEKLREVDAVAIGVRYEPKSNNIIVTFWAKNTVNVAEYVGQQSNMAIVVEYKDPKDAPQTTATHGGEAYSGCTGGFMATRGSSYGVTTSAHCTTVPSTYNGSDTGATYVASNKYDVRFTTLTGSSAQNKIRIDSSGTLRSITSTGVMTVGLTLFRYGKTTGYGGSTVTKYHGCVAFTSGREWCGLYSTGKTSLVKGGDSGGPWFVASKGYGFTTGSSVDASYISAVAYVASIPGTVKVKTS